MENIKVKCEPDNNGELLHGHSYSRGISILYLYLYVYVWFHKEDRGRKEELTGKFIHAYLYWLH